MGRRHCWSCGFLQFHLHAAHPINARVWHIVCISVLSRVYRSNSASIFPCAPETEKETGGRLHGAKRCHDCDATKPCWQVLRFIRVLAAEQYVRLQRSQDNQRESMYMVQG